MKIQAISTAIFRPAATNTKQNQYISNNNSKDKLTFTGFDNVLKKAVNTNYEKESLIYPEFEKIIKAVLEDSNIVKEKYFYDLSTLYKEKGLYGVLKSLWEANPQSKIAQSVNLITQGNLILAKRDKLPVVELFKFGKHGFFSSITSPKTASNDVRLSFMNKDDLIEYTLNNNGEMVVHRKMGDRTVTTSYHIVTGHRKEEIIHNGVNPEITYYNKDGSKPFWKNFIFGGTRVEGIY